MSINGTYRVTVMVKGKPESANVELSQHDDILTATAKGLPVVGTVSASGTILPDGSFTASGTQKVLFKRVTYSVKGHVDENGLTASAISNMGNFTATGVRVA